MTQSTSETQSTNPKFLWVLFFVEMWERFSYYGMRAILVLFLTSKLGFADGKAYATYSVSAALAFAVPVLGGILADRLMGFRNMVFLGGIVITIGHISMTLIPLEPNLTYFGLALIAVGTGCFKGNVTNLLGACYKDNYSGREKGFTVFHVSVNLGSFLAGISCGVVAHKFGWHYAFGLAGFGMIIGLLTFLKYEYIFKDCGSSPRPDLMKKNLFLGLKITQILFAACLVLAIGVMVILQNSTSFDNLLKYLGVLIGLIFTGVIYYADSDSRKNLIVLIILIIFLMFFLALEMQLGSLINLFASRNVVQSVFGITIPAALSQSINPFSILVFGFLVSNFITFNKKFALAKFAFGLLTMAICFGILYIGCTEANEHGRVDYIYLFSAISFMGLGEIMTIPFIYSQLTLLAPPKLKGFMMGILMLSLAFSNLAGLVISKFMSIPSLKGEVDSLQSLPIYQEGFLEITKFNMILFLIFLLFIPIINKLLKKPVK